MTCAENFEGRFVYRLSGIRAVELPTRATGRQGIWTSRSKAQTQTARLLPLACAEESAMRLATTMRGGFSARAASCARMVGDRGNGEVTIR